MNYHQRRTIILFVFLLAVGACAFLISVKEAEGRVMTVGRTGANYTMIQDALYFANDGDTIIVHEGSYFENIVINRSITLRGAGAETTKIDALMNGHVVVITSDNVNISGFKITGAGPVGFAGILVTSHHNRISENNVTDNLYGITLFGANHNTLVNNTGWLCDGKGILLDHSSYNTLEGNTFGMNGDGIYLYHSFFNTISNNTCFENDMGIELYRSDHNTVNGNFLSWNRYYGLHPLTSHFNTIVNNQFSFNTIAGISVIENTTNVLTGNDRDQDGVIDEQDGFIYDPSASVDADRDGHPDEWNSDMTAEDSRDELHLDHFPDDPSASQDSDGDGHPDAWNSGYNISLGSTTGLKLDAFPHDPEEWKDTDGDGYGNNQDDFPNTGYLHSYLRFFGTLILIVGISIGSYRKHRSFLQGDCRRLITEIGLKQDEARFHKVPFEMEGFRSSEGLFEKERYWKARNGLNDEKDILTELLDDHHLAFELIEFVEHSLKWARDNEFDDDIKEVEHAREKLNESNQKLDDANYKDSISLSREAFRSIKALKESLEDLELHMLNAENDMTIASHSVSIDGIQPILSSVQDLYKERKLEDASGTLTRMMDDLKELRRTAIPNVTLTYTGAHEVEEWTWFPVILKNEGKAHARNIRMTVRQEELRLKHEKIHRLASGEEQKTEIAVKLPPGHDGRISILTTSMDQTLETPYEHEVEVVLDLQHDEKTDERGSDIVREDEPHDDTLSDRASEEAGPENTKEDHGTPTSEGDEEPRAEGGGIIERDTDNAE